MIASPRVSAPPRDLRAAWRVAVWLTAAAALVAAWEVWARMTPASEYILPAPSRVLPALIAVLGDRAFWGHFRVTMVEVALGVLIAFWAGLFVGLSVGTRAYLREVVDPILLGLFSAPKILFLPLFMLAFGIDVLQKTLFGAFHGFFVVAVNVIGGLAQVDRELVTASRSMGATRGQIWRHILVPSIIPLLLAGLRLAVGLTFLGVLVAELAVARAGLGFVLNRAADSGNVPRLFALILLIGATAVMVNGALSAYQQRLIRWHG